MSNILFEWSRLEAIHSKCQFLFPQKKKQKTFFPIDLNYVFKWLKLLQTYNSFA